VPNVEAPRRSRRIKRSAIPDDYEVYNTEGLQMEGDPTSFEEAMRSEQSSKWLKAMEDEMESMNANKVWDLETIPKGAKTVGCKWVYRTKHDSKGNIERDKARLVAKGFTQVSGTIIRGTLKTPKSQLVTPISTKLQRPDGCD
jgi:hypothetical protein